MLRRLLLLIALPWIAPCQQTVIKPTTTIRLFDGKTLDNFDPWQQDNHERDPDKVFSVVDQVDGAPAIRISGQHWGGLITKSAYRDYKLVVEFRWGLLTWGQRKDRARDSGILLHCQGRPGSYQKDFNGPWMRSIEFQMIDGGVGDIILVGGYEDNGELLRPVLKAKTRKDRDGETVFDPTVSPVRTRLAASTGGAAAKIGWTSSASAGLPTPNTRAASGTTWRPSFRTATSNTSLTAGS